MPQPVLSSVATRLYTAVAPLAKQDEQYGWPLANFCKALGDMFQVVDDYGRDQIVNGKVAPGWSQLLDLTRAPYAALQWLGQFVGAVVPVGVDDITARQTISNVQSWQRGTVQSMIDAAEVTLTGTQQVIITERDGDPWTVSVVTRSSETPSPPATLAALKSRKPAGILLFYQNLDGQRYGDLIVNAPTYANVYSGYATYQDLLYNNLSSIPPNAGTMGSGFFGDGTFGGG